MAPVAAKSYDYLVLGAGSGGLGSARRAAEYGAKTAIIEHGPIGGTCVGYDYYEIRRSKISKNLNSNLQIAFLKKNSFVTDVKSKQCYVFNWITGL